MPTIGGTSLPGVVILGADGSLAGTITPQTVSIANGTSLSPSFDLASNRLAAIQIPAAWTAAALTFQGSADNVTFGDVWDGVAGLELTVASAAVAANRLIVVDFAKFYGMRYMKIRSGTSGTPVNQGAQRDLKIMAAGR